jgi:mannosyltransferase OCH1-like enzyme
MIPKLIHQTWKTAEVPEKYAAYQQKLLALHPGWAYKLWTDEDNLALVKDHFPDFYETYIGFPKNIMRADAIRYLIMYKLGGLYLDLDYEMLKPFDLLNYDLVLPYNRQRVFGDAYDGLGNCIFASVPGHPFWKYVLDDLKGMTDYEKTFKSLSDKPYVTNRTTLEEAITGPVLLTKVYYAHREELENYTLPAREEFHPPSTTDVAKLSPRSYGIHHCSGTWRDTSIVKKITSGLKRLVRS